MRHAPLLRGVKLIAIASLSRTEDHVVEAGRDASLTGAVQRNRLYDEVAWIEQVRSVVDPNDERAVRVRPVVPIGENGPPRATRAHGGCEAGPR